jgi:hypothetical protein
VHAAARSEGQERLEAAREPRAIVVLDDEHGEHCEKALLAVASTEARWSSPWATPTARDDAQENDAAFFVEEVTCDTLRTT